MIKYLLLLIPFCASGNDYLDKTHITIGTAYKINESIYSSQGKEYEQSPTARIELYYQYSERVKFGVSHHSQWLKGRPFNDDWEYSKTELFIDYTFSLGDLF